MLGELPDGIPLAAWDGSDPAPAAIADTEFWVPPYLPGALDKFAAMPGLRVVQLLTAGFEPWLPVIPDGVVLCNGRGVHGSSTAELALTGILALLRRLPEVVEQQAEHRWAPLETYELAGRRALVVGAGDIGRRVADRLRAFEVEVTLVGHTARDGVHGASELADLLPRHSIVVLATPLTANTWGLVDAAFLGALPDGALVINISRGGVVDTDALLAELTSRRLRAFLDVTDPEPLPSDHPLWTAPGVLITPHIGGGTLGWERRAYQLVGDQVRRYARGEQLINVVRAR
ncbi:MAG: 2-hydroxyacid dehydrogenase [Actinomycetota bacterium]